MISENIEKRGANRSRLPRTGKKVDKQRLESEMEGLGLVIENKNEVQ